jgi:hypothetical protein
MVAIYFRRPLSSIILSISYWRRSVNGLRAYSAIPQLQG